MVINQKLLHALNHAKQRIADCKQKYKKRYQNKQCKYCKNSISDSLSNISGNDSVDHGAVVGSHADGAIDAYGEINPQEKKGHRKSSSVSQLPEYKKPTIADPPPGTTISEIRRKKVVKMTGYQKIKEQRK